MISLALSLAAVTLVVLALLLWPLLKTREADLGRRAHTLAVHRDQLAEVERDRARGLLNEAQAEAARTEIHRRILAAERTDSDPAAGATGARLPAIAAVAACVPLASIMIYLVLGSPIRPQTPAAAPEAAVSEPAASPEIIAMVDRLAERLKREPGDAEGWAMLARSYSMLGRHKEAADAHGRAAALSNYAPSIVAAQAEELIIAANGAVTPEALALLTQAQAADASDPRARFYLGLARAQAEDVAGAQRIWMELERDAPANAEWLPGLKEQIRRAAEDLGQTPAQLAEKRAEIAARPGKPIAAAPVERTPVEPAAPRGPNASDVAAAGQMTPAERNQMIEGMVASLAARLETQPADPEGWQRLARAYRVLGRGAEAELAARKALDYAPDRLIGLRIYASGILEAAGQNPPPASLEPVLNEIISLSPDDSLALWNLGLIAAAQERPEEARRSWTRLLAKTPEGAPERARLVDRIKQLP